MKRQMQVLLDDSLDFYQERQLKKALNTAQIAISFGETSADGDDGLAIAYLLLANIYNTNGKYQNEPDFFDRAAFCLEKAKAHAQVADTPELQAEMAIVEGRILLNKDEFEKAEKAFGQALAIAKGKNLHGKLVFAYAGLGMLALAKHDASRCLQIAMQIEQLVELSNGHTPPPLKAEKFLLFSQAYILLQDYSASLQNSQELLHLSRQLGDVEKEVLALRNIAVVCGVKSNYKIGMQYFLEALDKCEQIGYREMVVQVQINIATLYAHLYNYEEAIRRYENVLSGHNDMLDDKTKTVVFNNIGNIYLTSDRPQMALGFFEQAFALARQNDFTDMLAYALAQLSRTKIALDQFEAAAEDANTAQQVFEAADLVNGKQINLLNLAQLAFQNGETEVAHDFALKAIELAQQVKDDSAEIKAYKLLSAIFKQNGNFEMALEYQERFTQIQEEFARLQRSRFNLDMEIRHAIREKQKEIELLTKENEFQSLLIEKSEQIARQNEELLRVNDDLRQFAYIASHDLKEPLRMIGSFTQVIEKLAKPHLVEGDREYFSYVKDGVLRMNNLLDGLLRYSTVNQSNEEMVDVSLNDVFQLSIANLKIRVIETNAVVERGELPTLKGTQQLFLQLFQNLIANAIKFVKPGTLPYVKVFAEETSTEHVIHIQDNGIGISPENQVKIFDIFKRLHHQSEYPGTGIGLAICQKIAIRLGGKISVNSELGEGSTFSLQLPKLKEESSQNQAAR
jgi:signal transduction histidine kinase